MLRILGDLNSGNCLKVLWVARRLGLAYHWIDVDVTTDRSASRRTRSAEFLALNPAGEVPVVLFPDGRGLAQSNAIIRYLARGTRLLPDDALAQAKIDEWLFWEQYSHEPYVAVVAFRCASSASPLRSVKPGVSNEVNVRWTAWKKRYREGHSSRTVISRSPTLLCSCTRGWPPKAVSTCGRARLCGIGSAAARRRSDYPRFIPDARSSSSERIDHAHPGSRHIGRIAGDQG